MGAKCAASVDGGGQREATRGLRPLRSLGRGAKVLATLALASCTTTVALTDEIPDPAELAQGEGLAIGSILVSTPDGVTDPADMEKVAALAQRTLRATIRRYELRGGDEGGEFSWRDYGGDEFVVALALDTERRIVLRAPAGKYEVHELSDNHPGPFGDQPGCKTEGLARFEVHAGKTTYIGRLVVRVGFKDKAQVMAEKGDDQTAGTFVAGFPERWLDLGLSVADAREASVLGSKPAEMDTELMKAGIGRWRLEVPPNPAVQRLHGGK